MLPNARDIMEKDFQTINENAPISEAARMIFSGKPRKTGFKPLGILVVDDLDRLVGIVSMADILYHLRPGFMNWEVETYQVSEQELEHQLHNFAGLRVCEVMSTPVAVCGPDESIVVIIDRMIKRRVRRLPVIDESKIVGVIYMSDIFYYLCKSWIKI